MSKPRGVAGVKLLEGVEQVIVTDSAPSLNSDFDWDRFDSTWYRDHNYRTLRDDDHKIMKAIRDFFAGAGLANGHGVDVGAGANLYPALSMLPFCSTLELREYSDSNVAWLTENVRHFDSSWNDFWQVFRSNTSYAAVRDPRAQLAAITSVHKASIFDLPAGRWDIGTMFFVACSLSTDMSEFERAVACFARSLKQDAPFAAAFMEKSTGYPVDGVWFPAVAVDSTDVARAFEPVAYDMHIDRITTDNPLRDGYDGAMILATGRRRRTG